MKFAIGKQVLKGALFVAEVYALGMAYGLGVAGGVAIVNEVREKVKHRKVRKSFENLQNILENDLKESAGV